jgi:hypothetical protein
MRVSVSNIFATDGLRLIERKEKGGRIGLIKIELKKIFPWKRTLQEEMIKMLKVKLHKSAFSLSTVCVTCGTTYVVEKVEAILLEGNKRIGNVCKECIKMGSQEIPMILRQQSQRLREKAKILEELSNRSIDCPAWDEYLQASGDKKLGSENECQEVKANPQMIMSRVFLIGEGIVPREELEGLKSEHVKTFLTELDISQWPPEILHLKKYTEIEIDDRYLFRFDEGM